MGYETHLDKAQSVLASHTKRRLTPQVMEGLDFKMYHTITLGTYPLRARQITANGKSSTIIQLGEMIYPLYEKSVFRPVMIRGKALKNWFFNPKFANLEIPVYISEDAFKRLMERSGHVISGFCKMDLVASFRKPVSHRLSTNLFLINFLMNDTKIGYLTAAMLKEGILVITDFLLMTDHNTFEGFVLHKFVRRHKFGAEYAAINSLSDLADTDILQNEAACKLFHDAGCQSLLDICEKFNEEEGSRWKICISDDDEMDINDINLNDDKDEFIEG